MSAKFEYGVFLSRDATLAQYMPLLCVRLCGVDVAYWQLSGCTYLPWALHSQHSQRAQSILCRDEWWCSSFKMTFGRTCQWPTHNVNTNESSEGTASYPDKPCNVEQSSSDFWRKWQCLMLECLSHNWNNPRQICVVLSQHNWMISAANKYSSFWSTDSLKLLLMSAELTHYDTWVNCIGFTVCWQTIETNYSYWQRKQN